MRMNAVKTVITILIVLNSCFLYGQSDGNDTTAKVVAVYRYIDKMPQPEFIGSLPGFLKKNMIMPARRNGRVYTYGNVLAEVIIDETGKVLQPVITHSPDTAFNTEALRLMRIMPKWKPAMLEGKPIKQIAKITIPFRE